MSTRIIHIVSLLFISSFSEAYQCPTKEKKIRSEIYHRYINSDIVALIQPYKVDHFEIEQDFSSYKLIHSRIITYWKGDRTYEIIIYDFDHPISSYLPIEINQKYLIFANGPNENGYYEVFTCDIEMLGKPKRKYKRILDDLQFGALELWSVDYYKLVPYKNSWPAMLMANKNQWFIQSSRITNTAQLFFYICRF